MLNVDEQTMRADLIRAFTHPRRRLLAGSQGSVQLLANGDVFVGWGAEPYYSEFRPDGALLLDGHLRRGESYRAFRFPSTGMPEVAPDIAVETSGEWRVTVYASWNGATEVVRWQVLGGPWWSRLVPLRTTDRAGFETAIDLPVPGGVHYVAVRAVDNRGNTLGTSRSVAI